MGYAYSIRYNQEKARRSGTLAKGTWIADQHAKVLPQLDGRKKIAEARTHGGEHIRKDQIGLENRSWEKLGLLLKHQTSIV